MVDQLAQQKTVNSLSYNNFGSYKIDPVEVSTILLNATWTVFLIVITVGLAYVSWEMIKQIKAKRISTEQLFNEFKKYDAAILKINGDLDNLGKKVRILEQRKY